MLLLSVRERFQTLVIIIGVNELCWKKGKHNKNIENDLLPALRNVLHFLHNILKYYLQIVCITLPALLQLDLKLLLTIFFLFFLPFNPLLFYYLNKKYK